MQCRHPNEYMYKDGDGQSRRVSRQEVPAGFIAWDIEFPEYDPIKFTAPHLKRAHYADPDVESPDFHPKWNQVDGQINRRSYEGQYKVRIRHEQCD